MIPLVALDLNLVTSYGPGNRTRVPGGGLYPREHLARIGTSAGRGTWRGTPGMARDLTRLDAAVRQFGGEGIRLTEVFRDPRDSDRARVLYDHWIRAGRPEPGTPGFDPRTMKTAYIRPGGRSNHNWGGAVDIDIEALGFTGSRVAARATNEALAAFWEIAAELGFMPILAEPLIHMSEAWHFDHLGPLEDVLRVFRAAGRDDTTYRDAYGWTAAVGCILTGTSTIPGQMERLVQARVLLAGEFCGLPDGAIGPKTLKALGRLGLDVKTGTPASVILGMMDEAGVAVDRAASA